MNRKITLLLFTLCLAMSASLAFGAENTVSSRITDIRFWQSPEEAQIVVDLTIAPSISKVSSLKNGTLYFDIVNCRFRPGRQRYPLQNPFIEVLSLQESLNGSVRVFFRVPKGVSPKTYVLPATQTKRNRIVIFLRESEVKTAKRRKAELSELNKLKSGNVKIVVLDAGHGGEDPGTVNGGIVEKDYVMSMAKLIQAYFNRDKRFKAVLTRSGDYIIPLQRRREIAEDLGADAFISLHANYNRKKSIRGIEVYYESAKGAETEAERLVAEAENSAEFAGTVVASTHDAKESKEDIIARQAAIMNKSRQLAEKVEASLAASVATLPSRGVKRAGFKVLHSMDMPSILIEFGYTSNVQDAAVLKNYNAKTRLAQAVYFGTRDFLCNPIKSGIDSDYLQYVKNQENKKIAAEKARKKSKQRPQQPKRQQLKKRQKQKKPR